jgi:hypothetical protein
MCGWCKVNIVDEKLMVVSVGDREDELEWIPDVFCQLCQHYRFPISRKDLTNAKAQLVMHQVREAILNGHCIELVNTPDITAHLNAHGIHRNEYDAQSAHSFVEFFEKRLYSGPDYLYE